MSAPFPNRTSTYYSHVNVRHARRTLDGPSHSARNPIDINVTVPPKIPTLGRCANSTPSSPGYVLPFRSQQQRNNHRRVYRNAVPCSKELGTDERRSEPLLGVRGLTIAARGSSGVVIVCSLESAEVVGKGEVAVLSSTPTEPLYPRHWPGMHLRPQICGFRTAEAVGYRDARIQRGGCLFVCKAEGFPAAWGWPDLNLPRGAYWRPAIGSYLR